MLSFLSREAHVAVKISLLSCYIEGSRDKETRTQNYSSV